MIQVKIRDTVLFLLMARTTPFIVKKYINPSITSVL